MSLRDIDPSPDLEHDIASDDPVWWEPAPGSDGVWIGRCRYCAAWSVEFPPGTHDIDCAWRLERSAGCSHGVRFDRALVEALSLPSSEVRGRFPRLAGPCPLGCGFDGIAYASRAHYVHGDW